MADLKKKLKEGNLPEEIQVEILETWEAERTADREQITADLREEFAAKYERDREQTVTAMNEMIQDVIAEETKSIKEERAALAKDRVKMKENIQKFAEFAIRKLGAEMVELHEDRKALEKNMVLFKEFFLRQVGQELTEFRGETKALAEARVKVLSEGREKIKEAKAEFVKRASEAAAKWIATETKREFGEFRKEINEARKIRFGQKIFESVAEEFRAYFYNEDAHIKQLSDAIAEREQKLEEANKSLEAKEQAIQEAQKAARVANDRIIRESKINSSLGHLPRDKRQVMMELLEDVQTSKLDESIKKYLPMVLKEQSSVSTREKKVLSEADRKAAKKIVTGDRTENVLAEATEVAEAEDEIDRIVFLGTRS